MFDQKVFREKIIINCGGEIPIIQKKACWAYWNQFSTFKLLRQIIISVTRLWVRKYKTGWLLFGGHSYVRAKKTLHTTCLPWSHRQGGG